MKKINIMIIILLLIIVQIGLIGQSKKLPLTGSEHPQEMNQWCWAACAHTIIDFYELEDYVSQATPLKQCNMVSWDNDNGYTSCCPTYCNSPNSMQAIERIVEHWGVPNATCIWDPYTTLQIKNCIDQDDLFVIFITGHFMTGYGYDDNGSGVYYWDVWPPNQGGYKYKTRSGLISDNGWHSTMPAENPGQVITPTPTSTATPTATATATPIIVNIAEGKPVSARSEYAVQYVAGNAVDGNSATAWGSTISGVDEWIYVDFGVPETIDGIGLDWHTKYFATSFSVWGSNDKINFVQILSDTKTSQGPDNYSGLSVADYQYVALLCTGKNSVAVGLSEFKVNQIQTITTPTPTAEPTPTPTVQECPDWAVNVTYTAGDCVAYNGSLYICVQGHTSLESWNPEAAASLWRLK